MQFFSFVWRNIRRRKVRSSLTIVGLAVAVAAMVALGGISDGFARHFEELYEQRDVDLVVQRVGSGTELNNGLPESFGKEIRALPHVTAALEGLTETQAFPQKDLLAVIVNGWPVDSPIFRDFELEPGGHFLTKQSHHEVLLGSVLAANLELKTGDTIELYGIPMKVAGVFKSVLRNGSNSVYENGSVAMPLSELQALAKRPNEVTGYIVRTDIPKGNSTESVAQRKALANKIESLRTGVAATPTTEFIGSLSVIKLARGATWAISAIAMFIGAISVLNTMVMSVYERIREIGTLRAIGWRKIRVMRMIVVESMVLSVGGAILGSLAALALTRFLSKMPMTSGLIGGDIAPIVIAEGFLLAIVIGFIGAIYPAYWASNLRPIEALRRK